MVTAANNEKLTRVEGDAPLGRMLRENFWVPFARSEGLVAGARPRRVSLLGRKLVMFRGRDGTPGLVDEHCPHRRASLALARVEACTLRCIYHGWRVDAGGRVAEVPSEGAQSDRFAARIRTNTYAVEEAGGLVWAYMGQGPAPALPPLPFLAAPPEARWWCRMTVPCNWLQGFEGALDSAHLNWLHRGWEDKAVPYPLTTPDYDIEPTGYGLRTAAIRHAPGEQHIRVAEFVAPFYALSSSRQPKIASDCSVFISVPMDDTSHMLFFGFWDEAGPLADVSGYFPAELDPDDLVDGSPGPEAGWGQDHDAIEGGHFSGFPASVLHEDVAVQTSMGPIVERHLENLCPTDLAIVRTRDFLLAMIERFEDGGEVDRDMTAYAREPNRPFGRIAPEGVDWRDLGMRIETAG